MFDIKGKVLVVLSEWGSKLLVRMQEEVSKLQKVGRDRQGTNA